MTQERDMSAEISELVRGQLGVELGNGGLDRALARVKQTVDQTGDVTDAQLRLIVDEVVSGAEVFQGVADTFR
jgi:F420-0:gamma-glutamyl ligase